MASAITPLPRINSEPNIQITVEMTRFLVLKHSQCVKNSNVDGTMFYEALFAEITKSPFAYASLTFVLWKHLCRKAARETASPTYRPLKNKYAREFLSKAYSLTHTVLKDRALTPTEKESERFQLQKIYAMGLPKTELKRFAVNPAVKIGPYTIHASTEDSPHSLLFSRVYPEESGHVYFKWQDPKLTGLKGIFTDEGTFVILSDNSILTTGVNFLPSAGAGWANTFGNYYHVDYLGCGADKCDSFWFVAVTPDLKLACVFNALDGANLTGEHGTIVKKTTQQGVCDKKQVFLFTFPDLRANNILLVTFENSPVSINLYKFNASTSAELGGFRHGVDKVFDFNATAESNLLPKRVYAISSLFGANWRAIVGSDDFSDEVGSLNLYFFTLVKRAASSAGAVRMSYSLWKVCPLSFGFKSPLPLGFAKVPILNVDVIIKADHLITVGVNFSAVESAPAIVTHKFRYIRAEYVATFTLNPVDQ